MALDFSVAIPHRNQVRMELIHINAELAAEQPNTMILQSFDIRGGVLEIAFTCNGGPREDEAFLVTFRGAILFHLPAVLSVTHSPVALFRLAAEAERKSLIPAVSYDAEEVSGQEGAFSVVVLENEHARLHGYYVAAESMEGKWVKRDACARVW